MKKSLIRRQQGQSLVEFALVVPLVLLLLSGIIDLGRYFYGDLQLQLAAQETVRLGGLGRSDAEIRAFAADYLDVADPAQLSVTITPEESVRESGDYVTVTLQRPFSFITPLPEEATAGLLDITASSTIRVE